MADPVIGFDWSTMSSIAIATGGAGSLLTYIFGRGGKAALLRKQVDDFTQNVKENRERIDAFGQENRRRIEAFEVELTKMREDFHDHTLADAAAFAKLESVASEAHRATVASEVRLTTAIENLGGRLDAMGKRFDEFVNVALTRMNGNGGTRKR